MKVRHRAKETVKVCFVSSWFPSKMNPFCTPFVPAFIKRFKKAGLEVGIITTSNKGEPTFDMKSEGIHNSIPVYRINRHFPFFQIFRLVVKLRPDIIHVHAPNFFSSFAVVVGKILRTPVLVTIHRVEVMPTKNPLVHFARRIVLNLFDRIVAVSEATKLRTENCGARKTKISVIWNSAEEDHFKPRSKKKARKLLGLPLEKAIILFVGRLAPVKGLRYLIQAMPSILSSQEALLVIVGDGPQRDDLQHLVKILNLRSCVLFLGHVDTEKLALCHNAADVFVLPSLVEGHSVALLEALASGLPVVATGVGGNNESIVDSNNGFLVDCMDHSALAQAIITILGDEKLRHRFSKKSSKLYFDNFSEKSQICKYISEYNKLLAN